MTLVSMSQYPEDFQKVFLEIYAGHFGEAAPKEVLVQPMEMNFLLLDLQEDIDHWKFEDFDKGRMFMNNILIDLADFPPIITNGYCVLDGYHRLFAHALLGRTLVPAICIHTNRMRQNETANP